MDENDPTLTQESTPNATLNNLPEERKTFFKKKKVMIIVALIVLLMNIGIFFSLQFFIDNKEVAKLGGERITEKDLSQQNERLEGFRRGNISPEENKSLIENRKKILKFAQESKIEVSDEEVEKRKAELIEKSGQSTINETLTSYGWSQADWTEVIRWQILREKIIAKIQPGRFGEVLLIRWDNFVPELTQEIANERSVKAKEFLSSARSKLVNKEIENFYVIQENFNLYNEPLFAGVEQNYGIQYQGWDKMTSKYREFLFSYDSNDYLLIMTSPIPFISDVICTIGGCKVYNITSGTNGEESADEILNLLTEKEIFF